MEQTSLSLQIDALEKDYARVSIVPPATGKRTPTGRLSLFDYSLYGDVCCVVDISGSMETDASITTASGETEGAGLIILDIVKHAGLIPSRRTTKNCQ